MRTFISRTTAVWGSLVRIFFLLAFISRVSIASAHLAPQTTSSGTVNYLVDTQNLTGYAQVIAEYDGASAAPLRVYAYGLDLISQRDSQNGTHYYGYDGHGSVRLLIKEDGSEETHYDYDAFGVLISQGSSTVENHYLYAGEQWDPDLGMYYLRARYLDAGTGRFRTMDPWEGSNEAPSSLHRYLYAHADPVNNVDPSGNMTLAAQVPTFGKMFTLAGLSLPSAAAVKATAVTLTLAVAAGASLSGSTEAAQEQAAIQAAEMTLAGAGTLVLPMNLRRHGRFGEHVTEIREFPRLCLYPDFCSLALLNTLRRHNSYMVRFYNAPIREQERRTDASPERQGISGTGQELGRISILFFCPRWKTQRERNGCSAGGELASRRNYWRGLPAGKNPAR